MEKRKPKQSSDAKTALAISHTRGDRVKSPTQSESKKGAQTNIPRYAGAIVRYHGTGATRAVSCSVRTIGGRKPIESAVVSERSINGNKSSRAHTRGTNSPT